MQSNNNITTLNDLKVKLGQSIESADLLSRSTSELKRMVTRMEVHTKQTSEKLREQVREMNEMIDKVRNRPTATLKELIVASLYNLVYPCRPLAQEINKWIINVTRQ